MGFLWFWWWPEVLFLPQLQSSLQRHYNELHLQSMLLLDKATFWLWVGTDLGSTILPNILDLILCSANQFNYSSSFTILKVSVCPWDASS